MKASIREHQKYRDPYAAAQARARKAANLSKQASLQEQRVRDLGDPIHGSTTPFVKSFDTGIPLPEESAGAHELQLNHFLAQEDIDQARTRSEELSKPTEQEVLAYIHSVQSKPEKDDTDRLLRSSFSPSKQEQEREAFEQREKDRLAGNEAAQAAIARIVSLKTGNSKDRTRSNIQRCIRAFGRHNTDSVLQPKPGAVPAGSAAGTQNLSGKERGGPDTGSSEVQIAILTAKIRVLANFLETRGKPDKVNKRNLRLLVHRRQKLLRYLRKKERGGSRWTNLIEKLGLTEGTWKGEISL